MCHDNHRLALVKLVEVLHYHTFVIGIERVGGFVKEDIVGGLIHGYGRPYAA